MKQKALISIALLFCLLVAVGCGGENATSTPAAIVPATSAPTTLVATAIAPPVPATATVAAVAPTATITAPDLTAAPTATISAPDATEAPPTSILTATVPAVATTAPVGELDENTTAIVNSLLALSHVKSYRMTQTIISAGTTITQTADVIPPDRIHATNSYGGGSMVSETIIISPTMWIRSPDGTWIVSDSTNIPSVLQASSDESIVSIYSSSISNVQNTGAETINGVDTQVYQYDIDLAEFNTKGTETIWIGSDNLPYKRASDTTVVIGEQTSTAQTTTFYYDFNADFTIDPPELTPTP